ncbi:MAG: c-type cytochrome biogenesis protein CcmI, partial [Proteobacteria bacterium]|nr:c-type cytochrome biogenesis protein CcmI [Pseudomonadota bacterium]
MLYLAFAALALATTGMLIFSLVARRSQNDDADRPDIDLYRAQLAELNDEEDRDLIGPEDAASARLEIERRLLRASDRELGVESRPLSRETRTLTAAGLLVLIPFMAAGLYFSLGSPDLPGQQPTPLSASLENASMDELLEKLAIRLTDNPDDLEGWLLMGRSAQNLGRFKLAIRAYENAIRLSPNSPGLYAGLGQSMVGNDAGRISPTARAAFETALTLKPDNPISRYYLGLADYQSGQYLNAYHRWTDLAADTPSDAPWAEPLQSGIASAQAKL